MLRHRKALCWYMRTPSLKKLASSAPQPSTNTTVEVWDDEANQLLQRAVYRLFKARASFQWASNKTAQWRWDIHFSAWRNLAWNNFRMIGWAVDLYVISDFPTSQPGKQRGCWGYNLRRQSRCGRAESFQTRGRTTRWTDSTRTSPLYPGWMQPLGWDTQVKQVLS